MAIGIHIVRIAFKAVNKITGSPIDKNSPSTTIADTLLTEHRHLVIPDSNIPSSAGYPEVSTYLTREAAINYVLKYMDQNTIVTYDQQDINSI